MEAYSNHGSGSRPNATIIEESPTQIEEDECDQWLPLALGQGNKDEEEDIGVLERHELHHLPISVASSPAPLEPMSGPGDRPMLVEESPLPHYIMVEDYLAPQCIVVQKSLVPMSGVKNPLCLVVESLEPTEDRAGYKSQVPMSGTKDPSSPVDDSAVVPKVDNLRWGGGNPVEGGSATLPESLVSPPSTTSPGEDPQSQILPNRGGDPEVATASDPVFPSHPRIQSPMEVHESPQHNVVDESPPPPLQPNTVGPVSPPPSARPRQAPYIERVHGIPHLIWPSCHGVRGGAIPLVGGRLRLLLRAPHTRLTPWGGTLVPLSQGGLLAEAVLVHFVLVGGWFLVSIFWGPPSNGGGGRTRANLWLSQVCGAC